MKKLLILFVAALLACGATVPAHAAKKVKTAFVPLESINDHGWTEAHYEA